MGDAGAAVSHDIAAEIAELAVQRLAQSLRLADEAAPLLASARADLEHDIKLRYGGDEVHIRQPRVAVDSRAAAVRRDQAAGLAPAQIIQRHGISRATLYRYLRQS